MTGILIAFASREGQTRKICNHIAARLTSAGCQVQVLDLVAGQPLPLIEHFDGAIVAGSVHRGRMDQALTSFLMCHAPALGKIPSAYLCVSLSAASVKRDARAAIDEITQQMLHDVGWHPDETRHVAGAVDPAALGLLERCAMHAVTNLHGIEIEHEDRTELTDWAAIDRFTETFIARVNGTDASNESQNAVKQAGE
ncbi:MAG: hypothetical protein KDJ37_06190 [Hyphomicrobiaceae bacterium]|nr:hypothetical protein [Hyphomicrobiaceae bacterium]